MLGARWRKVAAFLQEQGCQDEDSHFGTTMRYELCVGGGQVRDWRIKQRRGPSLLIPR